MPMAKRTSTSMAQCDLERGVVRFAEPALDLALRLLSPGPFLEPHPPGLEPLVAAGLAIDPAAADHLSAPSSLRLTPWCADLLAVVAEAHFAAEVQVFIGTQAWRLNCKIGSCQTIDFQISPNCSSSFVTNAIGRSFTIQKTRRCRSCLSQPSCWNSSNGGMEQNSMRIGSGREKK